MRGSSLDHHGDQYEVSVSREQLNARSLSYWRGHPIEFIETVLFDPEMRRPFKLLAAERAFLAHAFKIGDNGKLCYMTNGSIVARRRAAKLRLKLSSNSL